MGNKKLYQKILEEVNTLNLSFYHTLLLTEMIHRKINHPLEGTDEIIRIVTEKEVPDKYKKKKGKYPITVSVKKELEGLESVLDQSDKIPEEAKRGWIVSGSVNYLTKKVMELL